MMKKVNIQKFSHDLNSQNVKPKISKQMFKEIILKKR